MHPSVFVFDPVTQTKNNLCLNLPMFGNVPMKKTQYFKITKGRVYNKNGMCFKNSNILPNIF